ncbi:hypothetical protein FQN50_000338 [Emmonsiellopsis sp. PD_5]|nr:hypothetical protein FQN50_000338 [Emmonsiellopsis sp. PD_5]
MPSDPVPVTTVEEMDYDDLAWDASDRVFDRWKTEKLLTEPPLRQIGRLIDKWHGGVPAELCHPGKGAFNVWMRMKFTDGSSAVARVPIPGKTMFPEEKIEREVAVMRFLQTCTTIPVPYVLHYGPAEENPSGMGPFIIMEYINHESDMVDVLNTPGLTRRDRPILNPAIPDNNLRAAYSQMASILLQLYKHPFSAIGSISKTARDDDFDDRWEVRHRPLTLNMNELVQLGGVSPSSLPTKPFQTSDSFYLALAEMHMAHLASQRNEAISSAEDCKHKYISRCLFRKLAREKRLSVTDPSGPFRLFCDDFRPANVLVDGHIKLSGAVDWEFTYSAPADFAHTPPFWLLMELPELWPRGLDDWTNTYEARLPVFLDVLREQEENALCRGILQERQSLAERMKQSWEAGDFWVNYAARRSWAFDLIYWRKIDRRFFGAGGIEDRLKLLTLEERAGMDGFIEKKMKEKAEHTLPLWPPE